MIEDEFDAWIEYRRMLEGKGDGEIYESDMTEEEILEQFGDELGGDLFAGDEQPLARPESAEDWREMSLEELMREAENL